MSTKKTACPYLERDISWMYFNRRIMQEARRDTVPLLERLSFLGIYSNNLDEFYRVRVASQNRVAEWGEKSGAKEAVLAKKTVRQISKLYSRYMKEYEETVHEVYAELARQNIFLINDTQADGGQLEFLRSYYHSKLEGLIVPVSFSSVKHLDHESDENIYMAVRAVRMSSSGKKMFEYAYFELPVQSCGRFIRLPDQDGKSYIMYLDDVVRCSLGYIFEGMGYSDMEAYAFKFTRDAEMEIDDDRRNGILQKISKGLKSRKKGAPLRVLYDESMPDDLQRRILSKLDLDKNDTVLRSGRYHNHKDLMKFPDCGRHELQFKPFPPIRRSALDGEGSILEKIQRQDSFLHVPYHSFFSFIRVLHEAAMSREVKSIKMTLYRLAKDSKVVRSLIGAARNGKKVTVVIELLARFDEESNMVWAQKLQEAGVKVIFGVEGLKVHSKLLHIGMKNGADIACVSTGNFHEGNARTYTDCILMTASRRIVKDVDQVFDFIEKPYIPVHFKELLVSPNDMKKRFVSLINTEIRNHKAGKPAYIRMKLNHVTDPVMVDKIYEAALAGVPVDMVVRGNCSLVTESLPEGCHLRINGIIDRYLEHSRIFIFAAGGQNKVFIGSADWMPRNLDNRIEVVTPVYDPAIKQEMMRIVDYGLRDSVQGRLVDGSGENLQWTCADPLPCGSQEALYRHYVELEAEESGRRLDR
ncbi:MAG: RNA degradosome polyphosphate kinase [Bacteroidetes bacterium]|uniref:Polyphosphate kinase n=1 Tax=Candidatus Cryptobacteroides intestinigallinarum TaxID=2840767 RepID=A0A9D9HL27_9BACT|nr:RNA degradosome polyphosphate kinase [Candidatus Cryptobacteroides intestinigallinarum]